MSLDIEKICRTCLALSGPLMSIFDGTGGTASGCVADMLRNFTKMKPKPDDKMPGKVCLACISEINRCYSFKMKCVNSNNTLLQLLPDAVREDDEAITMLHKGIQTRPERPKQMVTKQVQTLSERQVQQSHQHVQTQWETHEVATSPLTGKHYKPEIKKAALKIEQTVEVLEDVKVNDMQQISFKRLHYDSQEPNDDEIIFELQNDGDEQEMSCAEDADVMGNDEEAASDSTAYYVLPNALAIGNDECEAAYESDNCNASYNEEDAQSHEAQDDYNFTIVNTAEGEITVSTQRASNKRKTFQRQAATQKYELKCPECIMSFVSIKTLRRHCLKVHDLPQSKLEIEQQPQSDRSASQEMILQELKAKEEEEEEESDDKQKVHNDVQFTTDAGICSPTYFCPRCSAGFAYRKSLNYHIKQSQCTAETFACPECQRVFNSKPCLDEHRESHVLQHACTECSLMFENKNVLSQHLIDVHNRSANNQCGVCKKVFTMRSALKDHLRIHTGEKPFLCTTCGKSFRQNANLKQHLMRHSQVKPYKCDQCAVCFVSKAELVSHKRTHAGDQPFKCDFCDARFTTSSSLVKHKRKHTGERPYGCEFCPLRFSALSVLKNHRRTHTGEKPYACIYCNKGFTQKSDCLIHQRTHTGEKPYTCHCGTSVTHLSTLRMHQKIHDNEGTNPTQRKRRKTEVINNTNAPQQMTTLTIISDDTLQEAEPFEAKPLIVNTATSGDEELVEVAMDDIC